jgi:iron complex outermembrane receptor protein
VETAYTRELAAGTLRWRTYYNSDHLGGRFDYPLDSTVEDNRTFSYSDWIGTQLTYRFDLPHLGTLTSGIEGEVDLRTYQGAQDVSPAPIEFVNIDRRDRSFALFVQDELRLSPRWKLDLGARLDLSASRHSFASPRAALIYQPSSVWTYKFLYGRSFRNPSAFQLFFDDGLSAVANPQARPEKADTFEIDAERKIGRRMSVAASAYTYRLRDFLVGVYTGSGLIQTQNVGRVSASGVELELTGHPAPWLETAGSYAIQRSVDNDPDGRLENSPQHLAKLRFTAPLGRKLTASSGMQYYSSRRTLAGAYVTPVYLADFTITSRGLLRNLDIQFGLRNGFNRNYSDPVALNSQVDAIRQPGRSIFIRLIAHAAR